MGYKESLYPHDWFRIGSKEINRAKLLLNMGDFEGAGFNIHQAVEKYLKGFLLSRGWKLRRIHDLEALLKDAVGYEPSFDRFHNDCQKITEYYIEDRYPSLVTSILTEEEVRSSIESTNDLINEIIRCINDEKDE